MDEKGLESYYIWKEGYTDGINLVGNFLKVLKNVEDKLLRKTIEMLQKDWSNYGKPEQAGRYESISNINLKNLKGGKKQKK